MSAVKPKKLMPNPKLKLPEPRAKILVIGELTRETADMMDVEELEDDITKLVDAVFENVNKKTKKH